jgi:hypothetical protein
LRNDEPYAKPQSDPAPTVVRNSEVAASEEARVEAQRFLAYVLDVFGEGAYIERISAYALKTKYPMEWPTFYKELGRAQSQDEISAIREEWRERIYTWPPGYREKANEWSAEQRARVYKETGERYLGPGKVAK